MNSKKLFIYHFIMLFIPATKMFSFTRWLLIWCGAELGDNVRIVSSAKFYTIGELKIGSNTWIGHEVLIIGGNAPIVIGKNCDIAPRVSLISGTHKLNSILEEKIAGEGYSLPIVIGDGCWLCTNAVILGGSVLGDKVLVSPNTVLKNSYKSAIFIGGNPARIIKEF